MNANVNLFVLLIVLGLVCVQAQERDEAIQAPEKRGELRTVIMKYEGYGAKG